MTEETRTFAAAPVGSLRFAAPAVPAAVSGTIDATSFGSPCPQSASPFGTASTNEDCLFLNVYVPGNSISPRNKLPVMVFYTAPGHRVQLRGAAPLQLLDRHTRADHFGERRGDAHERWHRRVAVQTMKRLDLLGSAKLLA